MSVKCTFSSFTWTLSHNSAGLSEEQGERFHQDIGSLKSATKAGGIWTFLQTTAGVWNGMWWLLTCGGFSFSKRNGFQPRSKKQPICRSRWDLAIEHIWFSPGSAFDLIRWGDRWKFPKICHFVALHAFCNRGHAYYTLSSHKDINTFLGKN